MDESLQYPSANHVAGALHSRRRKSDFFFLFRYNSSMSSTILPYPTSLVHEFIFRWRFVLVHTYRGPCPVFPSCEFLFPGQANTAWKRVNQSVF